uniref:Thioredoxin domain-containing protein n=1 Tax=Rhabditophanes sp. KR3021 TaxID=114890 RepID=A0AC35U1C0_9BILA
MSQFLATADIFKPDGTSAKGAELLKDKLVLLYFSGSYCNPCHIFTPKLKRAYDTLIDQGQQISVVLVTKDKTIEAFQEYYNEKMPTFNYLAFGDPIIPQLLEKYQVKLIPCVRIIRPDGSVAVKDGVEDVRTKEQDIDGMFEEWDCYANI